MPYSVLRLRAWDGRCLVQQSLGPGVSGTTLSSSEQVSINSNSAPSPEVTGAFAEFLNNRSSLDRLGIPLCT